MRNTAGVTAVDMIPSTKIYRIVRWHTKQVDRKRETHRLSCSTNQGTK